MHAYMGEALDEQGVDLLLKMLRYNPDERISVRLSAGQCMGTQINLVYLNHTV